MHFHFRLGRAGFGRGGFGHGGFGPFSHEPGKRMFGHGDLRFVILSFLKEQPRHGYEIIKLIEEKSSGQYTPSPGVIYPTLTFLEEGGFATAQTNDNKKLYTITEAGVALLKENQEMVTAMLERMTKIGKKMSTFRDWSGEHHSRSRRGGPSRHAIREAFHALKAEMLSLVDSSDETKEKLAEILKRTIEEIKNLKG